MASNQIGPARHTRDWSRIHEAVLGLLAEQPAHAYGIGVMLRERLPCVEVEAHSIYWTLDGLQKEGCIEALPVSVGASRKPRDRRVEYKATLDGIAHLHRWLHSPISEPTLRDELLTRLAVCARDDVPRLLELVTEQELICLEQIRDLQFSMDDVPVQRPRRGSSAEWHKVLRVLSRDCELAHWSSRCEWLQSVREMLEPLAVKPAASSRPRR